jgi:hypothetical protein
MDQLKNENELFLLKTTYNLRKFELLVKEKVLKTIGDFCLLFLKNLAIDTTMQEDWQSAWGDTPIPKEPVTKKDFAEFFTSIEGCFGSNKELKNIYEYLQNFVWIAELLEGIEEPVLYTYVSDEPNFKRFIVNSYFDNSDRNIDNLKEEINKIYTKVKDISNINSVIHYSNRGAVLDTVDGVTSFEIVSLSNKLEELRQHQEAVSLVKAFKEREHELIQSIGIAGPGLETPTKIKFREALARARKIINDSEKTIL